MAFAGTGNNRTGLRSQGHAAKHDLKQNLTGHKLFLTAAARNTNKNT